MNHNTKQFLTVAQAAKISGYSAWQIRQFCRQGLLPATRRVSANGGRNTHIRIAAVDLDQFLMARPVAG